MIKAISVKTELDFEKIKLNYAKEPLKYGIYVLTGKENLFKKSFVAAMHSSAFKDEGESEMNYGVFYDKNDAPDYSPLETADTPPFGAKFRLITIYKYNNFQDDFIDYCHNPSKSSIVILETENDLSEDSLYKYFSNSSKKQNIDYLHFINFPHPEEKDFKGLINSYINRKGKRISSEAVEYLINNINLDYNSLYSELEKICDYNDKEDLNVEDVADFTYVSKNKNVFDFLDAVFERDRRKCFGMMKRLDQEASNSLPLMINNFMALYYMKIFPPQTTLNEISKITKIPVFILTKKKSALKSFSLTEIVSVISQISRLNVLSVTAPNNVFKARFELMIFNITK